MQILGNIFNAIIFVSVVGSIYTVILLFINHIFRFNLPLWFSFCGMILFCFPFLSPDVFLVSPEKQDWLNGFRVVSFLWACGCGMFLVCDILRLMLAKRAIKSYRICNNKRLNHVYFQCVTVITLKKIPVLYCGALDTPICVTGIIHPVIIMNEAMLEQLTDIELSAVFSHELIHVKRKHVLLNRMYDYVCILNWMNPFSWIAKGNFSLHCETDCDSNTMKILQGKVTREEYAFAIIRLLEYSTGRAAKSGNGIGALDFLLTKRRIKRITTRTSVIKDKMIEIMLAVLLALLLVLSMRFSREYFYPYPAYDTGIEYSAGYNE